MFRKFSLIWAIVFFTILGALYVKFVYPDLSEANEAIDLHVAYNLPPEQLQEWFEDYSPEEVRTMVEEHIQNEIKNGAEPVYGTITLNEDAQQLVLESEQKTKDDSTFIERFIEFLANEAFQ